MEIKSSTLRTLILTPLLLPTSEVTKTIYTKLKGKIRLQNVSSDAVVTYKTSNKSIATVNSNGLITGKKKVTLMARR